MADQFAYPMFIKLQDEHFLTNQRKAGKIAAQTLLLLQDLVKSRTTKSLLELNEIAENYIMEQGGIPTFKSYGSPPFPAGCCISVNCQLVHGVPTDAYLKEHDMVSFDLGVTIEGAIADTALTCVYGSPTPEQEALMSATQECLQRAINAIKVGSRIGVIGDAIYKCARGYDYNVYTAFGGHGIDLNKPHAQPFIANRASSDEGVRICEGMVLAVEPLLTRGSTETRVAEDHWSIIGKQLNCHYEHTLFIHKDQVEIITDRSPYV